MHDKSITIVCQWFIDRVVFYLGNMEALLNIQKWNANTEAHV